MNCITIATPGGPDVLTLTERPAPEPGHAELLVKVKAAGVNRPDVFQRKGNYPPPAWTSPDIPGLEISGIVEGVGPGATRWKVGDAVCALLTGGGYAEYVAVPEGQCLPIPPNLSFIEAASLPETFFTVWSNVFDRGKLAAGETLLVHGGSSGIGVTAIQLARAAGATVWVTAGSDEKCQFCLELGASLAINYKQQDFQEVILSSKLKCDVILDMVGGDYTQRNLDILNDDGRLVLINHMEGEQVSLKLGPVLRKRLTITGSTLRARNTAFKSAIARSLEKEVWPWLIDGTVRPIIDKTFPLADANEAHRWMEGSTHIGKIVLTVGE